MEPEITETEKPRVLEPGASPYFTERARQSWRTLGYGAMALPFLWGLHVPGFVLAGAAAAFLAPSIWNFIVSQRERNGDELPASFTYAGGRQERRELGNLTFRRLLDKWKAELSFEDLVTAAAHCSNDFNRRLCVIYVKTPNLPPVMRDFLATLLRERIRGTDEVSLVSHREFIICAPFLRDALAADVIYDRLARALRGVELESGALEVHLGKAVYPMDGYTGGELIDHARKSSRAMIPAQAAA